MKKLFLELLIGDYFHFDGNRYMKIEPCQNYFGPMNAIYMRDGFVGRLCEFDIHCEVLVAGMLTACDTPRHRARFT